MGEVKIIAVTNRKGGVGKSTMAAHIGAGLATRGLRVALVDTDSQGHASLMLGMPDENGLYNTLINKLPLADVVRPVPPERYCMGDEPPAGELYLLPSSDLTYKVPAELSAMESFLFLETLQNMADWLALDVILIDTNPTMNLFDGAVYLATDHYLYVTECERLSLDGIQTAITQMRRFNAHRQKYLSRSSSILGVIPNKMRPNTAVHRMNISALGEALPGLVWPPVRMRTAWVEASNVQETMFTYKPHGEECRDVWALVERTLEAIAWTAKTS